jgi:hypothetical protein
MLNEKMVSIIFHFSISIITGFTKIKINYIYLMKKVCALLFFSMAVCANAQVLKTEGKVCKKAEVDISNIILDLDPLVQNIDVQPLPSAAYGNLKKELAIKRSQKQKNNYTNKQTRGTAPNPIIVKGIAGNNGGTPLDNDISVSNNGLVLSCINSNIRITDDTFKNVVAFKSLTALASSLGVFSWISDPRVIYDPQADRWIMNFFSGADSWDTHIIIGFSKTNRPDSAWTFYDLPGNSFNDSTWSDYPILAVNDNDVFLTYNHVKDNVSWQIGFKQSVIWQIDKQSGYNADTTLPYTLWSNLKLNDSSYRNICPAKPQILPFGNSMHFVSVRNVAVSNDSVFLFTINNSQKSGAATLNIQTLKTDIAYGFPPNVPMPAGQQLMTNDGRVLAAIYTNDKIYFGANTVDTTYMSSGIYLGTINNVSTTPTVSGKIISDDTVDYAYPSLCYLGNGIGADERILYSFSRCNAQGYAGCSMLYKNAANDYSDVVTLKYGASGINALTDSTERWGDYSGTYRRYNRPNTAYIANSFASSNTQRTWLALVQTPDMPASISTNESIEEQAAELYPNPVLNTDRVNIGFTLQHRTKVNIKLYTIQGKLVAQLPNDYLKPGRQTLSISTANLPQGNYILKGEGNNETIFTKQFVK